MTDTAYDNVKRIHIRGFIRRITAVFVALCIVCNLSGCAVSIDRPAEEGRDIEPIPEGDAGRTQGPTSGDGASVSDTEAGNARFPDAYDGGVGDDEYDVGGMEATYGSTGLDGYSDDEIAAAAAVNVGRFAYERLDSASKRVYNEMYLTLKNLSDEYELDCGDTDAINRIFLCVMMDHPEIFWVSGYVYTRYTRGDVLEAMGFKGAYTMDKQTVASRQASIDAYVGNCMSGMPSSDDYAKIKYVYEYIIKNTDYDTSAVDNQNICSVFINGRSVCQGYAKATQYLLEKAGVQCTLITGTAFGTGNHAWNLVRSNGAYYYLDTTWGDSNYRTEEGMEDTIPTISYDYLCVPGYEIFLTHDPEPPVDLPVCSAISDNYYVREGAYFHGIDDAAFAGLFEKAYERGDSFVTLKASDETAYALIRQFMLDEQNVFKYTGGRLGSNTISYWENSDLYTISFNLR